MIRDFHAHIYFNPDEVDEARALGASASAKFGVAEGHYHLRPVGPHPRGSCQLAFGSELFARVIPWLIVNRRGLTVFAHAESGDAMKDHTEHVLWLGPSETLNLAALSRP